MKRRVFVTLLAVLVVGLPFRSLAQSSGEIQKLYEAAKKEGEVAYWTESDPDEVDLVIKKFNEKYPGIKVKHFEISAAQAVERIILETKAKRTSWDALEASVTRVLPLPERGLIEKFNWRSIFPLSPKSIAMDDWGILTHHLAYTNIYNTNLVPRDQAPKTWNDFLDPKWKNKLAIESRAVIFAGLAMSWGEEKADAYVQKLKGQAPMLIKGGTTLLQIVSTGERPIGIGTYISKVPFWHKKGAPLEWARVSPVYATAYAIYMPKNPMHPNATKLFAGFYGTPEAQQALEKAAYKCFINPESATEMAKTIQKEGLEVIIVDTEEKAQKDIKLQMKYAEMLGALK